MAKSRKKGEKKKRQVGVDAARKCQTPGKSSNHLIADFRLSIAD
jgi:hypothetical protein